MAVSNVIDPEVKSVEGLTKVDVNNISEIDPFVIVACFPSNADCKPDVLAIVNEPSVIVACLESN